MSTIEKLTPEEQRIVVLELTERGHTEEIVALAADCSLDVVREMLAEQRPRFIEPSSGARGGVVSPVAS